MLDRALWPLITLLVGALFIQGCGGYHVKCTMDTN